MAVDAISAIVGVGGAAEAAAGPTPVKRDGISHGESVGASEGGLVDQVDYRQVANSEELH